MEHTLEIDTIKKELRVTQDAVLLIHKDLQLMSSGITEMASSMKIMVQVQSDMRLMNERSESRYLGQKAINERLDLRIDKTDKTVKDKAEIVEKQAEHGDTAYSILKWVGGILGSTMLVAALGSWVYVLTLQEVH